MEEGLYLYEGSAMDKGVAPASDKILSVI